MPAGKHIIDDKTNFILQPGQTRYFDFNLNDTEKKFLKKIMDDEDFCILYFNACRDSCFRLYIDGIKFFDTKTVSYGKRPPILVLKSGKYYVKLQGRRCIGRKGPKFLARGFLYEEDSVEERISINKHQTVVLHAKYTDSFYTINPHYLDYIEIPSHREIIIK